MLCTKMSRVCVVLLMAVAMVTMAAVSARADYLTGVSIAGVSNETADQPASNLLNDVGLSGGYLATARFDDYVVPYGGPEMWSDCNPGNASVTPQYVTFDLGATYNLTGTHIWNYNARESWFSNGAGWVQLFEAGMKNVSIQTSPSVTNPVWTDHFVTLDEGWGNYPPAGGTTSTYAGQEVALSADNVQAVRILASSTYADSNYWYTYSYGPNFNMTGLGKVRFEGTYVGPSTPEPSTIVLLATGVFSLLCYAWRKRK